MPTRFHSSSILRYSVILFCRFLAAIRLAGLMFSSPMNTRVTPARRDFSMKFGMRVAERVDLDHEADVHAVLFAQLDDAVVDRFPILVAGEIVVGDEEAVDALRPVHAQDLLDAVGGAVARFASLHVDDGAERALEGAAAAGVEARHVADGALDEIVRAGRAARRCRRCPAGPSYNCRAASAVPRAASRDHLVEAFLGLAGEDRDAERLRLLDVARGSPCSMAGSPRRGSRRSSPGCRLRAAAGRYRRARGNSFDCTPTMPTRPSPPCSAMRRIDLVRHDAGVGLVDGNDVDRQVGAEHAALGGAVGQADTPRRASSTAWSSAAIARHSRRRRNATV